MPGRCFIAVELPHRVVATLQRAQVALVEAQPAWQGEKWVAPELLHLTIAFLGAVPDSALDDVVSGLREVALRHEPVAAQLDGVRAVPDRRHATMLWATMLADAARLAALRDDSLRAAGCEPDGRGFSPHVTLVRARHPRRVAAPALAEASGILSRSGKGPDGAMSVPSLTVFSSTLRPDGPAYRALAHLPLLGGL